MPKNIPIKLIKVLASVATGLIAPSVNAQQRIVITGSRIYDYGYFSTNDAYAFSTSWNQSYEGGGGGGGGGSSESYDPVARKSGMNSLCTIPGKEELAKTVSTDPQEKRADAVRALVGINAVTLAARQVWTTLLNGPTAVIAGQKYIRIVVIYADDGSEEFYANPLLTDNSKPVPNSLKLGNGIATGILCGS